MAKPFAIGDRVHCAVRSCPFYTDQGVISAIYLPGDPHSATDPYWHDKTKVLVTWETAGPANAFIPSDLQRV
jgi:hypothetical protein